MRVLVLVVGVVFMGGMAMADETPWYESAYFGLHYDLHASEGDTELGRETTYEHIREMLEKVQPDFVQYDCKGHAGWSGYPTEVGYASPGIVNDALRIWRDVTLDMGIPLMIHFSGVFDMEAIKRNPDWARIDADGNPNPNYTDFLSDYAEELMIPQLIEAVTTYDLDGVWIDGENWASLPSWSDRVIEAFQEQTGIETVPRNRNEPHWDEWLAFNRGLFVDHVTRYTEALHEAQPGIAVGSNWMYSVRQPEPIEAPVDYLSGDFDPSFGAERAAAEARFLASRNMPWNLMAWSFLQTGGQGWTMKPLPHICQEVAVGVAQGGAVFIYNQPQRTGRLTEWHQDLLAGVARFARKRQPYSHRTETIPQVAVLHSETFYYRNNDPLFNFGQANHSMEGALHALLENGYSVDILNEEMLLDRMDQYPVVVVPEQEGLPDSVVDGLRAYVRQGGRLMVSGTHVSRELSELVGASPIEGNIHAGGYLPVEDGVVNVTGQFQAVALEGADELAALHYQQEPNLNRHDFPVATIHSYGDGRVVAIHGNLFRAYYVSHYAGVRRFVGNMMNALEATGLARVHGPWWIEMAARQRDGKQLIQLVNRSVGGTQSPQRHMVEHVPDTGSFTITVPMPERPTRCYMAPDEVGLEWTWHDGQLTATIGGLSIHNVLVIE